MDSQVKLVPPHIYIDMKATKRDLDSAIREVIKLFEEAFPEGIDMQVSTMEPTKWQLTLRQIDNVEYLLGYLGDYLDIQEN